MLTFKLNINRQTFNNNIATAEKSPIFKPHKLYTNTLAIIRQKGKMRYYLLLICTIFIISCSNRTNNSNNNILTVGNGNDVEVTLNIEDKKNIEKIEFYSNGNSEFIDKKRLESYNRFIYNFENKGEGTFKVCIYKTNDTICTESYVEKGYTPKIEFIKDSLIITDFIGLNYE